MIAMKNENWPENWLYNCDLSDNLKHSHVVCQRGGEIILWATVTVDKRVRTVRGWSEQQPNIIQHVRILRWDKVSKITYPLFVHGFTRFKSHKTFLIYNFSKWFSVFNICMIKWQYSLPLHIQIVGRRLFIFIGF